MQPTYKARFILGGSGRIATLSVPRDITSEEAEQIAGILVETAKRAAAPVRAAS